MTTHEQRHAIEELVYRSCLALDAKDWKGFLDLCDPAFRYTITTYSPEIRKDMIWLDHDRAGIDTLFGNLPKHNSDHSPITRHATVYTVDVDDGGEQAKVVSRAAGVPHRARRRRDRALRGRALPRHGQAERRRTEARCTRTVRLDTRLLGFGYHVPF